MKLLARAQLDRGFGAARGQRRDHEVVELDRAFVAKLADFRTDAHRDAAVGKHDRRERQADAILLIFDGHRAERLGNRDRKFAAGQEAGGFARKRGQVRLGEDRDETVLCSEVERAEQVERRSILPDSAERRAAGEIVEVRRYGSADTGDRICRAGGDIDRPASRPMPNWNPPVGRG